MSKNKKGIGMSALLTFGLLIVFVGQKVIGGGEYQSAISLSGFALVLGATLWRALSLRFFSDPAKAVEKRILVSYVGIITALLMYFFTTESGADVLSLSEENKVSGLLAVAFPALFVVSLLSLIFMENAWWRMPLEETAELRRVMNAGSKGIGIALALIFAGGVGYASVKQDIEKDVSYFKTTEPSEGTLAIASSLSEKVRIKLIYPKVSPVLDQLKPYFDKLAKKAKNISVSRVDHALAGDVVQKHRIEGNGSILILRGEGDSEQAEKLSIGEDLLRARSTLRKLDGKFRERFARLVTLRKEIHFTSGHGERSSFGEPGDDDKTKTKTLDELLKANNFAQLKLGLQQGLNEKVPDDAPALAILGPRTGFLNTEADALLRYVEGGGHLIVLAEGKETHGLEPLFEPLGISFEPGEVALSRPDVRITGTDADKGVVLGLKYNSHPSVGRLSGSGGRIPTLFYHASSIKHEKKKGVDVRYPIKRTGEVWRDLNGNFQKDEEDTIGDVNLMAAITVKKKGKEGRIVLIADGDFFSDGWVKDPRLGNAEVLGSTIQWLIGSEDVVSVPTTEEDVPIEHSGEKEKIWFWLTSIVIPMLPLALGIFVYIRRGKKSLAKKSSTKTKKEIAIEDQSEENNEENKS